MATRSRISIEQSPGVYDSIYCHFDGYLDGVGAMLLKHYTDRSKVQALMDLGGISELQKNLSPAANQKHSYDRPLPNVTVAFERDRGDHTMPAYRNCTLDDLLQISEQYNYVFTLSDEWKLLEGRDLVDFRPMLAKIDNDE